MKIFIDPGHRNSKYDHGAIAGGVKESAIALAIAKKVEKLLTSHNVVCYMSRWSEDDVISLNNRIRKANNLNPVLYLSIHINSATDKDVSGAEVLAYSPNDFAKGMCDNICKATGANNRGPKVRTDLAVLRDTKAQALVVECGFLTNEIERNRLLDEQYKEKIAQAIADSIIKHYKITVDDDKQYKDAVDILVKHGVIKSPEAWYPQDKINVKYVPQLIKNMANELRG